jgi:hypothetical protein
LEEEGWEGSVGAGASCYRITNVEHGWQFFVREPDGESAAPVAGATCYAYTGEGFGSDPYFESSREIGGLFCNTYPSSGERVEGDVRYLVVAGTKGAVGSKYLLRAEP